MLRDYQIKALDLIRKEFSSGKRRALLHMATGAGKTLCFSEILKGLEVKGNRGLMVTRGRKLIDQCHKRLLRENVNHGVLMANHNAWNPNKSLQLVSIDTANARQIYPRADMIVIDEVHYASSPTFQHFVAQYPRALILGVTATPFTNKSLRHVADTIIAPISVSELIDQGYLVDGKYYAPREPDLKNVHTASTGDYMVSELSDAMMKGQLVGDVVSEWIKLGENRSTLCFCVDLKHSEAVCHAFNGAGIQARCIDAGTSDSMRDGYIAALEAGRIKVICSVGTMTTGVDIPSLGCLIMARPTKSYVLHVQMLGRGTRIVPGKDNFLVLDHASNLMKHGTFRDVDQAQASIDGKVPEMKINIRTCKKCYAVFASKPGPCPCCGHQETPLAHGRDIDQIEGELQEFKPDLAMQTFQQLKIIQKVKGYRRGWLFFRMKDMFGEDVANQYVPKRIVPSWVKRG